VTGLVHDEVWGTPKSKNGSVVVVTTFVEVTCTTPGASRRKIPLIVSALPGVAVSKEVGEMPPSTGSIWRTVVVLPPIPNASTPSSETAPPRTLAPTSAAAGRRFPRELTFRL
jgi:hypothetical protein